MQLEGFKRFLKPRYKPIRFPPNTLAIRVKSRAYSEVRVIRILFRQLLDEKSFRERRRISLDEVCEETGLSRPTVSRVANIPGHVTSTETIERLCRYFGCTPGELLVLVDEKPDGHPPK